MSASVATLPWRPSGPAAIDAFRAKRHFVLQQLLHALFVHDEQHQIDLFGAGLKSPAALGQLHENGGLQRSADRQLMAPLPYSPPKMNAAFFTSGITTAQRLSTRSPPGCPS
jgi:hypothetical protein